MVQFKDILGKPSFDVQVVFCLVFCEVLEYRRRVKDGWIREVRATYYKLPARLIGDILNHILPPPHETRALGIGISNEALLLQETNTHYNPALYSVLSLMDLLLV